MNRSSIDIAIRSLISFVFLMALIGCVPTNRTYVKEFKNGYSEAVHYRGLVHVRPSSELWYQSPEGKKQLVWRNIFSQAISDNVILFKGPIFLNEGDAIPSQNRFFVFQPPGPVVDVTDELLEQAAREKGMNYEKARKTAHPGSLEIGNGGVLVEFDFVDWADPYTKTEVTWSRLLEIIREAREKGSLHTDPVYKIPYKKLEIESEAKK